MSTPSMTTEPSSGFSRPMIVFRRTDLPVPDGPSITQISPAGTVRVTSFQMSDLPNDLVRCSILISTPMDSPSQTTDSRVVTPDTPLSKPTSNRGLSYADIT